MDQIDLFAILFKIILSNIYYEIIDITNMSWTVEYFYVYHEFIGYWNIHITVGN